MMARPVAWGAQVKEEDDEGKRVLLTPPLALEGGLAVEYKAPSSLERILTLFKNVRPGSDLLRFQLPPSFNIPKPQLQLHGECVYCIGEDLLSRCARGNSALERFINVVAWNISMTRPFIFGFAPFNPILGETHHVSRGNLNVLLEQVSHHPPVTALHATDEMENVELIWTQSPIPTFHGTSVDIVVHGKKHLNLLNFGENYDMNSPRFMVRFLPKPGVFWVANVRILCKESGLEADICFKGHTFLGLGGSGRSIRGKIFNSASGETLYDIDGRWDRITTIKHASSGKITVLHNAYDTITNLKTPELQDQKGLLPTESALIWSEVSKGIINKEWDKARDAKRAIEENERKLDRERKAKGVSWVPKYFNVAHTKEGWECTPNQQRIPPAPIIVEI